MVCKSDDLQLLLQSRCYFPGTSECIKPLYHCIVMIGTACVSARCDIFVFDVLHHPGKRYCVLLSLHNFR
jgi:hypothetical protein